MATAAATHTSQYATPFLMDFSGSCALPENHEALREDDGPQHLFEFEFAALLSGAQNFSAIERPLVGKLPGAHCFGDASGGAIEPCRRGERNDRAAAGLEQIEMGG